MTAPKIRALQALADATDRPFLASAPLMAIVEAVQVLNEAGLFGGDGAGRPATDAARALREYPNASAAAEEAMRNGIEAALKQHDEGDLRDHLQLLLDRIEVTDAALVMCELADDAEKAKAVLEDEGFQGRTLEAQVRALLVAWNDERDEARRGRFARSVALESLIQLHELADTIGDEHLGQNSRGLQYLYATRSGFDALGVGSYEGARAEHCPDAAASPCPDCGVVDESHLGGCDDVAPAPDRAPCPKCGRPLTIGGECLNFPLCPDATIPF